MTQARNFLEGQRAHMAAEERIFFPAALAKLTEVHWSDLSARAAAGVDPLFGPSADERFAGLRRHIDAFSAAQR